MKSLLIALLMVSSSMAAARSLECVAGKKIGEPTFQSLKLAQGNLLKTNYVNKAGKTIDLKIDSIDKVSDVYEISGAAEMDKGLVCAGDCGTWTYRLLIGTMPDTQENALFELVYSRFSEEIGLRYTTVTTSSYRCKYDGL